MEIKFNGKLALVTGASRGIGKVIALTLAKSGADVVVNYHTNKTGAEEVCEEIKRMGQRSIAIQADVANANEVDMMVGKVAESFGGRIDILVNNAAVHSVYKEVIFMTNEEWDAVLDTNLRGTFYVTRAVVKKMIEKNAGGCVINIASLAGHGGRHGNVHYCASKAGIILFSKALAIELAPRGIRVNSISLGFVDHGQLDGPDLIHIKKDILQRILLRRPGKPEDIANMVAFLASKQADWITGADFVIDGGESAGRVPELIACNCAR